MAISVPSTTMSAKELTINPIVGDGNNTSTALPMHYKSGKLIESSLTLPKVYDTVYIGFYGTALLTITTDIYTTTISITSGSIDNFKVIPIKIPQEFKRGYFIQFELTGIFIVHEIKYDVIQAGG